MPKIYELYQLMPGKDCGICGSISCRQFARRLAVGEEKAEKCTYMGQDAALKAGALLKAGVEIYRKPPPREELLIIRPCQHDARKVMTESRIGDEAKYGIIDPFEMCKLAKKCALFNNQKCSEKLGIATFQYGNTEVVLYDNGKINIKQADNKEEAIKAIATADKIFRAAYLCPECGGSATDCAKGFCRCDMGCKLLPPEKEARGMDVEMGAEEIESAGMGLLTGKDVRAGLLLMALAECMGTLGKAGKEEIERIKNNQECMKHIKKDLNQV